MSAPVESDVGSKIEETSRVESEPQENDGLPVVKNQSVRFSVIQGEGGGEEFGAYQRRYR